MNTKQKLPKGVTQLPSGNYRRRFKINGKRMSVTDSNLDALMEYTDKLIKRAKDSDSWAVKRFTLDSFYNEWVKSFRTRSIRNTTIATNDSQYYSQISPTLGKRPIDAISPFEVNDFYFNMLDIGLSLNYAKNIFVLLNSIMEAAVSLHIIDHNPCDAITLRTQCDNSMNLGARTLNANEVELFFKIMKDVECCDLLKVMFLTGMRIGEVSALRFSDLNEDNTFSVSGTIGRVYSEKYDKITNYLHTAKTFSGNRILPLTQPLREIFEQKRTLYQKAREMYGNTWGVVSVVEGDLLENEYKVDIDDFIFLTKRGDLFVATTINSIINYRINKWNSMHEEQIAPVSTHDLRDTYASFAYADKADKQLLKRLMGHASFKTTDKSYISIANEESYKQAIAYNQHYLNLIQDD